MTKSAICNAKLVIYLTYPSPFELVDRDLQAKDHAQENADLVKASLKVRVDSLLSNAFNHRIHNEHLVAEEGIRRMFRWRAEAEFALKPEFTAPGQSFISQKPPPMSPKSVACPLSCTRRIDEVASDLQRKDRRAAWAGSEPKGSATRFLPYDF
jgi:hypothetical protein